MSSFSANTTARPNWNASFDKFSNLTKFAFVSGIALFIVIAFMIPIDRAWTVSMTEHYADSADSMEEGANAGVWGRQLALGSLGLFGLVAAACPGGRSLRIYWPLAGLCVLFLIWSGASCLWADDPPLVLRRFVSLLCEICVGLGIARRTSPRQFVWIVLICSSAWLGLGILAELSLNTLQPWKVGYRFAGVLHPNAMGFNCALAIMSSLYLSRSMSNHRWLFWTMLMIAALFLFFTRSRTALGCTIFVLAIAWLVVAPRRYLFAAVLVGTCLSTIVLALFGSRLASMATGAVTLGRVDDDMSSLTGRVPLWNNLLEYVAERPLTGYGYNAFWTVEHMRDVSHVQYWSVSSGHSAYIDLLLSVGYIGLTLCLLAILVALFRAIYLERRWPRVGYGFVAMTLGYAMIAGVSETTIGITWFVSLFCICGLCQLVFIELAPPRQLLRQPAIVPRSSSPATLTSPGGIDAQQ